MTIKKSSFQVFWIKMGYYQNNMKWGDLISVQPFWRFLASESVSQIWICYQLIYPKIHNENKQLGFCRLMQRKLFAAYKSPLTNINRAICTKAEACWVNPSCLRTRRGNHMYTLELYLQMRRGSNVSGSKRKCLLHAHTVSAHHDLCFELWGKIKKCNHKWKNKSLEFF